MTDRHSSKDISLKISGLPVIPMKEITITSGVLRPDRSLTFRYYGDIPLTNGSQFIIDAESRKYRAVARHKKPQYGRHAAIMSSV